MKCLVIRRGIFTIYALDDGSGKHLRSSFEDMEKQYAATVDGFLSLFDHIANSHDGPASLPDSMSHQVDDKEAIWEFIKSRFRVLWFYDRNKIVVCTHCFMKKSQRTPRNETNLAIKLKRQYFDAQKSGSLEIVEDDDDEDV